MTRQTGHRTPAVYTPHVASPSGASPLVESARLVREASAAPELHAVVRKLLQAVEREAGARRGRAAVSGGEGEAVAVAERAVAFHGLDLTHAIEEIVECLHGLVDRAVHDAATHAPRATPEVLRPLVEDLVGQAMARARHQAEDRPTDRPGSAMSEAHAMGRVSPAPASTTQETP